MGTEPDHPPAARGFRRRRRGGGADARAHRYRRRGHFHRHLPRRRERRADCGADARTLSRTWRKPRSPATSRRRSARWPLLGVTVIHRYGRIAAGRGHRAGGDGIEPSRSGVRGGRIPDGLSENPRAVLEAGREGERQSLGRGQSRPTMLAAERWSAPRPPREAAK